MSSGDYINLLKIRNSDASRTTASAQTQSVMINTITKGNRIINIIIVYRHRSRSTKINRNTNTIQKLNIKYIDYIK